MSFVLMVVGLLATAIGAILIGFGIPINEFSLGNTLILAGTVTIVGGLVIFAISRAVSQLSRIGDALASRPFSVPAAMPSEAYDPHPDVGRHAPPRGPAAPRPRADTPPAPRAPEPRLQADEFELPEEVEPVRPPPPARTNPADSTAAAASAPKPGWRPPRPSAEPRPAAKPAPDAPRPAAGSDNPFDAAWEDRKAPPPAAAPARREPAPAPAASSEPARQEPVSVLKSGVVDGMAYTLYTDGSIEAELAQGVVRFGSIEELRNHLEKSA